jgi:hypothetical protein
MSDRELTKVFEELNIIMSGYRETLYSLLKIEENRKAAEDLFDSTLNTLVKVDRNVYNMEDFIIIGFKIGYSSNQILILYEEAKETIENIVVLPVENAEHCAKIMRRHFDWDDGEIERIPYIITEIMTKKLSEYFSK